jgi:hypothetical protein
MNSTLNLFNTLQWRSRFDRVIGSNNTVGPAGPAVTESTSTPGNASTSAPGNGNIGYTFESAFFDNETGADISSLFRNINGFTSFFNTTWFVQNDPINTDDLEDVEVGVDSDKLPDVMSDYPYDINKNDYCTICQYSFSETITENSNAEFIKTICGHVYCKTCILNWFSKSKKCPDCSKDVVEILETITQTPEVST